MANKAKNPDVVALDVETTGLQIPGGGVAHPDEIIQLAIVSDTQTLYNEYFKPEHNSIKPAAQKVNSISYAMTKSKPLFSERVEEIRSVLSKADLIVMYNAEFDTAFLKHQRAYTGWPPAFCMMKAFSYMRSRNNKTYQKERRYSLEQCASYFTVHISGYVHDAQVYAKTTLACYREMCRQIGLWKRQDNGYGQNYVY